MKKPRFTEPQIALALRQAEQGTTAAEVCRKLGVSEATFYVWKKRYGELRAPLLHVHAHMYHCWASFVRLGLARRA